MTGRAVSCSKSARGHLAERAAAVFRLFGRILLLASAFGAIVSTPPASSTTSTKRALAEVDAAKRQWIAGSKAFSYETSTHLRGAAADLLRVLDYGVSDRLALHEAIVHLRQLAALPETSDTPAQIETAHRDLVSLNRFFDTKRLYE